MQYHCYQKNDRLYLQPKIQEPSLMTPDGIPIKILPIISMENHGNGGFLEVGYPKLMVSSGKI